MALRGRLPDELAMYPTPDSGLDLRSAVGDVGPGHARLLKNIINDGGTTIRRGSTRLTTASLGAFKGRGGVRYYYGASSSKRIVAYSTKISVLDDAGAETVLTSGMTSDLDTHFSPWIIDSALYISNGTDTIRSYDGTSFATVSGTNIPTGKMVTPFLDRVFCIQGSGVVPSNPRVSNVWAPTTSTWSFYRPFVGSGNPTALHIHSATSSDATPLGQLLIFMQSSVTALSGTNFGSDVTAATAPAEWDANLTTVEGRYGTLSPYSVCSVPGKGTFWFTQDKQVAWLQWGANQARIVSDNIWSNQSAINGVNKTNASALSQVVMTYHDRKLKLFLPVNSDNYPTVQYWLDLRYLDQPNPVIHWTGPMIGQSVGRVWVEDQAGDTGTLYGLEGNSATGMFAYRLDQPNVWTDAVGTADVAFTYDYHQIYHPLGAPSRMKWVPRVRIGCQGNPNTAAVTLRELHGNTSVGSLSIKDMNGNAFAASSKWGTGTKWGDGRKWGGSSGPQLGEVWVGEQTTDEFMGDRVSVEVTASGGFFGVDSIIPEAQIKPNMRTS